MQKSSVISQTSTSKIVEEDIEQIKSGSYISKIDKYFNSFYEKQETILDYLNENYCIFLDQISKIRQKMPKEKDANKKFKELNIRTLSILLIKTIYKYNPVFFPTL